MSGILTLAPISQFSDINWNFTKITFGFKKISVHFEPVIKGNHQILSVGASDINWPINRSLSPV